MTDTARAAHLLSSHWRDRTHLEQLPTECRPATRAEAYAVQARWAQWAGPIAGWKIAATSLAGQRHIAVDGPLAGPVFASRVHENGPTLSLVRNRMRVAECEVVFTFRRTLQPRAQPWSRDEALAEVQAVLPGIEIPDSRFIHFERAGEAQLIADCACCHEMVLGQPLMPEGRLDQLASLRVQARVSDGRHFSGVGANALGDPVEALCWFISEMSQAGQTIEAGQFVTTGACVTPIPVEPGQAVEADFGWLGAMKVQFAAMGESASYEVAA